MTRLFRIALDLRALRHPRRLVRYTSLRRESALVVDRQSLRVLPAYLDAPITRPFAHSLSEATRDLPVLERWVSRFGALPDTCLYRAVARYVLLRSAGVVPRLCVGATADHVSDAGLVGHAWIELDGAPFLEPDDPRARFTTTWSHPATGSVG